MTAECVNMRVIIFYVTGFCFFTFGDNCGPSEYKSTNEQCCPMCGMGLRVHQDCTSDLSTTCKPCIPGTFISEPNGLHKCFECSHCDESQGLYIQSKCTTIKDTICDVLDGYYCEVYSNSQCRHAKKHSVCIPGQEKKKEGTKTSDTVCENCTYGFYSPSGLNCNKWTDCAARNEIKTEDGSPEKDVTCEAKRERYGLLALLTTPVIFAAVLAELYRRSHSKVQKGINVEFEKSEKGSQSYTVTAGKGSNMQKMLEIKESGLIFLKNRAQFNCSGQTKDLRTTIKQN